MQTYKYLNVISLVLNACRLLTGYSAQDISDWVLCISYHQTKDVTQETLFPPNDPGITAKTDVKAYIY